jgi:hypothetical protein
MWLLEVELVKSH